MKLILKILSGIAVVILVILVIAVFTKKEYTVQREITINRPQQEVFDYIKLVKNQLNYNKWWQMDPNVKTDFRGTDGTVGFVAAWDSKDKHAGKGEQEIKSITSNENVEWELRFIKPFEGIADTRMTTTAVTPDQTQVHWQFHSKMKYPMNVMLLVMNMDKMLGKDLEASLVNLKNILEK